MSLFLITNNKDRVKIIEKEFNKLFNKNAETINLDNQLFLTVTAAYRDQIVRKKTKSGNIFGFGTFFSKEGFHEDALQSVDDLDSFLNQQRKGLFGHYILVIQEKESLHVVTDKIGMLNVYYTEKDGKFYISNDLVTASISSNNTCLSEQGSKQFIMRESTIGRYTIFKDVNRLCLGNLLKATKDNIREEKIYSYNLESLTLDEYIERITDYFTCLNRFNKKISADMSGGFDTRMIAAIGHKLVEHLEANTNPNQFDGGIDEKLSPIIAEKLKLPLTIISNKTSVEIEKPLMLHGFSVGRDIIRSKQWPNRMKTKYEKCKLVLGGYGGETLRAAKHNKTNKISQIVEGYYNGREAENLFELQGYINTSIEELKSYQFDELTLNYQNANWIYSVDRMRIWGGAQVLMSSLYGDILHPFMDWHLINPIFLWDVSELKNGKRQQEIIKRFAPELENIPINSLKNKQDFIGSIKTKGKNKIKYNNNLRLIIMKTRRTIYRKQNKRRLEEFYKSFPKANFDIELLKTIGIDLTKFEEYGDVGMISRIATLMETIKYIKTIK